MPFWFWFNESVIGYCTEGNIHVGFICAIFPVFVELRYSILGEVVNQGINGVLVGVSANLGSLK